MNKTDYEIRPVRSADLDQLYSMLVELVKYEGLYERFKLTRGRLDHELFGEHADWHCLVAAQNKENVIGFCLYTFANINRAFNISPMIQIDDLYVSPEYRKQNIGQNLIHQLALVAKSKNISRLNAWCVKDNVQGQNFYKKIGAEKRDFVDIYSIPIAQFLQKRI